MQADQAGLLRVQHLMSCMVKAYMTSHAGEAALADAASNDQRLSGAAACLIAHPARQSVLKGTPQSNDGNLVSDGNWHKQDGSCRCYV